MSISEAHFRGRLGITSNTMFLLNVEFVVMAFVVHFARGEGQGTSVSRDVILHHGLHRFAYGKPCVQPWQNIFVRVQKLCPSSEGGSSPQMVERRDTHFHVDPCVYDEALLFGANGTR